MKKSSLQTTAIHRILNTGTTIILTILLLATMGSCTSKSGQIVKQREALEERMLYQITFPVLSDAMGMPDTPELREKAYRARALVHHVLITRPEGTTKKLGPSTSPTLQHVIISIPIDMDVYTIEILNEKNDDEIGITDFLSISKRRSGFKNTSNQDFIVADKGLNGRITAGYVSSELATDGKERLYLDGETQDAMYQEYFQGIYDEWVGLLLDHYNNNQGMQKLNVTMK